MQPAMKAAAAVRCWLCCWVVGRQRKSPILGWKCQSEITQQLSLKGHQHTEQGCFSGKHQSLLLLPQVTHSSYLMGSCNQSPGNVNSLALCEALISVRAMTTLQEFHCSLCWVTVSKALNHLLIQVLKAHPRCKTEPQVPHLGIVCMMKISCPRTDSFISTLVSEKDGKQSQFCFQTSG